MIYFNATASNYPRAPKLFIFVPLGHLRFLLPSLMNQKNKTKADSVHRNSKMSTCPRAANTIYEAPNVLI